MKQRLETLSSTDTALIVSPGQNEISQMQKLGLDIEVHRKRMNESQPALDEKFKDTEDPLDAGLPRAYTPELYQQKCSALFEHVYESYPERNAGVYAGHA